MRLIDQWIECEVCGGRMDYEARGEWLCDCGHSYLSNHLHAKDFAAWLNSLLDLDARHKMYGASFTRAYHRWRFEVEAVNVYQADGWLCMFDLTLSDVPDELWVEKPTRKPTVFLSDEEKATILARVQAGEAKSHLAKEYGVTARAIHDWQLATA